MDESQNEDRTQHYVLPEEMTQNNVHINPDSILNLAKHFAPAKDNSIPEEISNKYWSLAGNEAVFSNLTKREVSIMLLTLEEIALWKELSTPSYLINFDEFIDESNTLLKAELKLNRSVAGFERLMQTTQTSTRTVTLNKPEQKEKKRGFLSKFFGGK